PVPESPGQLPGQLPGPLLGRLRGQLAGRLPGRLLGRLRGRARRAPLQLALGCAGLALFAVGAAVTVTAAQREWVPPPELSIEMGQGHSGRPVASVDLGTAASASARLAVVTGGRILWSAPLSSSSGTQNVVLPADALDPGSPVVLIANARTIRDVDG
ncbi:MAG: hypothetical protein ACRDSH_11675, partial [Pseudonocardiaceae bacterium]